MSFKQSKNTRTLDMYVRLCEGKTINKIEEAEKFGVDPRSIQRDIDDIRAFLDERAVESSTEQRSIEYDRGRKGYVMRGQESSLMTNSEILAVSKILLESRAFTGNEIGVILDKMIAGCVPHKNMKLVTDLIANEKFHYVELKHKSYIQDKLWTLGQDIKECNLLEITYEKHNPNRQKITRIIEPVAILFSEYYFYLNGYIVEKDDSGRYVHKYEYPGIFRVDRLLDFKPTGEKFHVEYANRFEEGEFRKRIQFMYAGKLLHVQFRYEGPNIDAISDRLPTAKVLSQNGEEYIISAECYGQGILMWLLSQGSSVEVLKPESMRNEMKSILQEILKKYDN